MMSKHSEKEVPASTKLLDTKLMDTKLVQLIKEKSELSIHARDLHRESRGFLPIPPRVLTIVIKNTNKKSKKEPIRFLRQEIIKEGDASS